MYIGTETRWQLWICIDFCKLNTITKSDSFPIPRIDDCIDKTGHAKFVSNLDLLKSFWQVPLKERAKKLSVFVTPKGLYQYKVVPFRMKNVPATFQWLISQLTQDLDGCEGYIDDIVIAIRLGNSTLNVFIYSSTGSHKLTSL